MILDETYRFIKTKYTDQIEKLKIDEARFGVFLTAVRLSDNSYGVASTVFDNQKHCLKKDRDYGDFSPSKIAGQSVLSLLESERKTGIIDSLKIAVLNAISSSILANGKYKIVENTDPVDLIDINSDKTITVVGAFNSYIQKISPTNSQLFVLELNKDAFIDEYKKYYVPAEKYNEVIPKSDIVIITGMTLVNNTLDGLLSSIKPKTNVIVTGPSSSLVPDILFQHKVKIIGATRIVNPELLFPIVSEFGAAYHLFNYCAQKICIINE